MPERPEPPQRRSARAAGGPAKAANGGRLGKWRRAEQHQFRQAVREDRWRLRRVAQTITELDRLRACGRRRCQAGDSVGVLWAGQDSPARLTGLQTCGSCWACPHCAAKIAAQRSDEVGRALAAHLEASPEHRIAFLTTTVRHTRGQRLSEVWDEVAAAWAAVHRTASWRGGARMLGDVQRFAIRGWVRSVEATYGDRNGWHVHCHAAVLLDRPISEAERATLADRIFARWSAACERKGFVAPSKKHGVDLVMIGDGSQQESASAIGKYLVKSGLALEVVGGTGKEARGENRTPWRILADIARARGEGRDCSRDIAIWRAWESGSKGRRQIAWSAGLRQQLLQDREKTDIEIAEEEPILRQEALVGVIPHRAWGEQGARDDLEMRADLLKSVEACKTAHEAVAVVPKILEAYGYASRPLARPLCVEAPDSGWGRAEKIARKRLPGEKSALFTPDFLDELTLF